jgi:hypothetical protein
MPRVKRADSVPGGATMEPVSCFQLLPLAVSLREYTVDAPVQSGVW